jgi:hypothetical protein
MARRNTPDDFWRRVTRGADSECWEWQGSKSSTGYGTVAWHGRVVPTHRLAYALHYGGISLDTGFRILGRAKSYRRFVLHKCDNRLCCNPNHLFLGSMRTNQLDAYKKGRKTQPRSGHVNAKLSPDEVRDIRASYDRGEKTQVALAGEYGVSQRAISLVVRRETYKDVD